MQFTRNALVVPVFQQSYQGVHSIFVEDAVDLHREQGRAGGLHNLKGYSSRQGATSRTKTLASVYPFLRYHFSSWSARSRVS